MRDQERKDQTSKLSEIVERIQHLGHVDGGVLQGVRVCYILLLSVYNLLGLYLRAWMSILF